MDIAAKREDRITLSQGSAKELPEDRAHVRAGSSGLSSSPTGDPRQKMILIAFVGAGANPVEQQRQRIADHQGTARID